MSANGLPEVSDVKNECGNVTGSVAVLHLPSLNLGQDAPRDVQLGRHAAFGNTGCVNEILYETNVKL